MDKSVKVIFKRIALLLIDTVMMLSICILLTLLAKNNDGMRSVFPLWDEKNLVLKYVESGVYVLCALVALNVFGAYRFRVRNLSITDLARAAAAFLSAYAVSLLFTALEAPELAVYTTACFILFMLGFLALRVVYYLIYNRVQITHAFSPEHPVLIVGAGAAGTMVAKELLRSPDKGWPLYFCDDDEEKIGMSIEGIRVVSSTMLIPDVCEKYHIQTIYIALPSASEKKMKSIQELCKKTSCAIYYLPFISSLITTKPFIKQTKKLDYSKVLEREEILLHSKRMEELINSKVVLVTGGGGSIGSELCRQISDFGPKRLVIVDIYENNAYDIQQELLMKNPELHLNVEIASVRDAEKMDFLFRKYEPQVVFHAAAHKHVPLMETDPEEAVKNNIGGTYNVASMAAKYHASKFVLISTDKAVNPTNVMGATKRFCEMIVQHIGSQNPDTCFAMVRFGNVLGSNGSVIPLFKKQIESGGPVKVTHPDIVRYFMTIPEAVSLVLQAGAMARGGEVFVLNMGEAVKILTLAENIIKFYGYRPYTDIPIQFTGLRPGEKLYEELLMDEEGLISTDNEKIFIGKQVDVDHTVFMEELTQILAAAEKNDSDEVLRLLHKVVVTYQVAPTTK